MKLNKAQSDAVNHKSGPLLIIAGAGTGKTAVITQRILNIVNKGWAMPSEVLALTFTEKSSKEMLERVDIEMPYGYEEMWISTFHSFCDKILRQESIFMGLNPNYKLMTESEAYILFRRNIFNMPLDIFRPLGNPSGFITQILNHFSRLQDEDITPDEYIQYAKSLKDETSEFSKELTKPQVLELANTYKVFTEIKLKESKLDFGDLINTVLKLFRDRPNILKKYHSRFKYILVDEFQDTNYTQNVLVNMIATGVDYKKMKGDVNFDRANITVVGDDDQSIYKFRGAAISNIIQFKQMYPNVKKVVLTENYRSKQEILDSAHRLVQNNNPYRLEVTEEINKKLIAKADFEKDEKDCINVILANMGSQEADLVANEIHGLVVKQEKFSFSDIAILVRSNNQSDDFVQSLRYMGIPYKFGGYKGLYNTDEIKTLISYLRLLCDYDSSIHIFNIFSLKTWGFEPREVVEIMRYSRKVNEPVFNLLESILESDDENILKLKGRLSSTALTSIGKIVKIISNGFKYVKEGKGVGYILYDFFEKSGWKALLIEEENQFKVENIRKYFEMIKSFEQSNSGSTIYEYLEYLEYSLEIGENPSVNNEGLLDYEGVNILTVHSAKGLEFPVVFMVNLIDDRFPTRSREDKLAIPNELIKEVLSGEEGSNEHIQEERRLFYVGMTRAKQKLYLCASKSYSGAGRTRRVSGFLNEALGRDVNEDLLKVEVKDEAVAFQVYQRTSGVDMIDYKKVGVQLSNQFSYSQLSTYEACPRQYKYSYILRIPQPASAALSFGNTVHNSLRTFYEKHNAARGGLEGQIDFPTKKSLVELYESFWESDGYESKEHEKRRFDFGKRSMERYFEHMYTKDDNPIELEKSFKYAIDDFSVIGKIDRIDLIENRDSVKHVEIIDYKSGKAKSQKDANSNWQLVFYALVAEKLWGFVVEKASYIYVEHGKKVEVSVTTRRKSNVIGKVRKIVEKIREGDFSVPRSHNCMYCSYNDICDDAIL